MPRHALLLLVAALAVSATAAAATGLVIVDGRASDSAGLSRTGIRSCGGTVEKECLGDSGLRLRRRLDDDEDEEQYISYSALRRDSVPCSVPGASYYNCQPDAEANPYTRGCSAITQCRG